MGDGYQRSLVRFFERHKELIVSAHKAADEKVKTKYKFLAEYHNKELRYFVPKQPNLRISL